MNVLVTRPDHCDEVHYLCEWFGEIFNACKSKDVHFQDLYHTRANRAEVITFLEKGNWDLIVFNGHGNENTIFGHDDLEVLTNIPADRKLLKNKVVYVIACLTTQQLGPKCISDGTTAYVGYSGLLTFYGDPCKNLLPLEDDLAKPIFEASNMVVLSLIKGNSAKEAVMKANVLIDKYISWYQGIDAPINAEGVVPILYDFKGSLTALDNSSA